jgi:Vitamin B12 dependent methionine synthase, activation domain
MDIKTFQFDFNDLSLSSSDIESVLGYNEGDNREFVKSLIEEILEESREISKIRAQFTIFNNIHLDDNSKSFGINNIRFHVKKTVYGQMKKSESIAVFLCTAGEEIGSRSRKAMKERDLLKGYIYDVIGSEIVESVADILQAEIELTALDSGKKITNRYSPGYCGWDVDEQHKLFELIPDNYCGIRLTPSALMDPIKSISGIIGIGKNVKSNPYTCMKCDQNDCVYRNIREKIKQQGI